MVSKGGTVSFLLLISFLAFANNQQLMPRKDDFRREAKYLRNPQMMKCHNKGYQVPKLKLLTTIFNNSDLPMDDRNTETASSLLSEFLGLLDKAAVGVPMDGSNTMTNKMWNCTYLLHLIRLMRNSSEASACYMQAFVAHASWRTLTTKCENRTDSDDYDAILWAAEPVLLEKLSSRMNRLFKVKHVNMKKIMKMLREAYDTMFDDQRIRVAKWTKEWITQSQFNCTMIPQSDSRSVMDRCKPSLKWLNLEEMTMVGPYLSHLRPDDVDSAPREAVCDYFNSSLFKSTFRSTTNMNPRLGKRFLQIVQECFVEKKELIKNVDRLGTLACYYYDAPDVTPDLSKKLLSQIENCNNPRLTQLKKRLVRSIISNSTTAGTLRELGSSIALLSSKQLSNIPDSTLKRVLKDLQPNIQWTQSQLHVLVKKQIGKKKCRVLSGGELRALQPLAEGLARCALRRLKAQEILNDREVLKNISKRMKKGQLKAMLEGLRRDANLAELVQKMPGPLLSIISLTDLKKASINSLDQVENKTWTRSQAAYLAKKMEDLNQLHYRRLRSILQGMTCKMVYNVADSDTQNMAKAITETPQWLSKVQVGCTARKLFATLEKGRADYFKNITMDELDEIPELLLPHLPPAKVMALPDSVCPVFLVKMAVANLSSLPRRSPSRPAFVQKALHCLTNGGDLSKLTSENVSDLGQLLCELSASQLRLMASRVIRSSLRAMASCHHIPQGHRADLIQLVKETFGEPFDWSADTMEELGPIVLLDDNVTSALPNKPWMKDVLYVLTPRLPRISDALRKWKFFYLITTSNETHMREDDINSNNKTEATVPTVEMIEILGKANAKWSSAQLDMMSVDTFLATVEILGDISGYNNEQLKVLSKKAIEAWGPAPQMNESVVMQMGCITQGFSNADLKRLPFPMDAMEKIARCGWKTSQLEPVWKGVAEYNNLTAQQLGAAEMVTLNQIICGLNSSEIEQLDKEAFMDAVGSMEGVQCSFMVAQQLKRLAVSAFGDPSKWTEAQVVDLAIIIRGLDANELASLNESVFPFLSPASIPLIPPENFAGLSVAQLEALGPDNADRATTEQRAALTEKQRAALERAVTGVPEQRKKKVQSGAPSLSIEGISALVKPLLFLLMVFLLL